MIDLEMRRLAEAAERGDKTALAPLADKLLEASPQDRLALVARLARIGRLLAEAESRRIPVLEGDAPRHVRIYEMSLHRGEQVFQASVRLPDRMEAGVRAHYDQQMVCDAMIAIGKATERGGWYAFRTRAEVRRDAFGYPGAAGTTRVMRADLTALHGGRIITREKE